MDAGQVAATLAVGPDLYRFGQRGVCARELFGRYRTRPAGPYSCTPARPRCSGWSKAAAPSWSPARRPSPWPCAGRPQPWYGSGYRRRGCPRVTATPRPTAPQPKARHDHATVVPAQGPPRSCNGGRRGRPNHDCMIVVWRCGVRGRGGYAGAGLPVSRRRASRRGARAPTRLAERRPGRVQGRRPRHNRRSRSIADRS